MKTFLTIVAVCVACSSFAQIGKGRSYLSGQVGGGSNKTSYSDPNVTGPEKRNHYDLGVSYGYLFADTWAVALSVNGGGNTTTYNTQNKSTGTDYGISPYVRKYFSLGEKLYIHLDGGLSYQNVKSKYEAPSTPSVTDSSKITSIYVSPGLTYFLSNRFALTANLGSVAYASSVNTATGSFKTTGKGFNTSFGLSSIGFGASIFF
jgi:outer membrane immunogenic protein